MLWYLLFGFGALVLVVLVLGLALGWFRPRGAHANFDQGFSTTAFAKLIAAPPRTTTAPHAQQGQPVDDSGAEGSA